MMEYRRNLEIAFNKLDADLPPSCLVIWNMTMPLGPRIKGGFLIPELQHLSQTLRQDIIEGNFYGATLADLHLFDVVDLHFHFRFDVGNRVKDGIHWNNVVHRRITNLLLTHLAEAWGVKEARRPVPFGLRRSGRWWDSNSFFDCRFCGRGLVGVAWWAGQGKDILQNPPSVPLPTNLLSRSVLLCRATKGDPADQLQAWLWWAWCSVGVAGWAWPSLVGVAWQAWQRKDILQNPPSLPPLLTCFPAPFSCAGQPKETQPISWDSMGGRE
uniref:PC-esterase domain containing 1A n=1 Tax=Pseudonaja textilis TaxID=8673 RepID=A0A670ZI01_PSETE